jgi:hypothetical protein
MGLKPRMQITERIDGQLTQASCTTCPHVAFHAGLTIGTDEDGQLRISEENQFSAAVSGSALPRPPLDAFASRLHDTAHHGA